MRQYEYIEALENIFLAVLNFISNIVYAFNFKLRKVLSRNSRLKGNGKRCFILGNGPSIRNVDLNQLQDEDTVTVNFFYDHGNNKGFVSKYYLAVDTAFYSGDPLEYLKKVHTDYPSLQMILKYDAFRSGAFTEEDNIHFIYAKLFQYKNLIRADCTKNMTAAINVVCQCIQVALHLGYKEIYLLGCDFSQYASLRPGHFYQPEAGLPRVTSMGSDAKWSAKVHYHHYALKKYADKQGVRIINLTPGSLIDAYPRDTLENVLAEGKIL